MPRNPAAVALQRLTVAQANDESARVAAATTGRLRREAIVAAVKAGNSKAAVARVAGTSDSRVNQICKEAE